jgi:hypothetical protein
LLSLKALNHRDTEGTEIFNVVIPQEHVGWVKRSLALFEYARFLALKRTVVFGMKIEKVSVPSVSLW